MFFYEEVAILGKTIHEETAINVFFNEEVAIFFGQGDEEIAINVFYEQGVAIWVVADEEITIWGKRLREEKNRWAL